MRRFIIIGTITAILVTGCAHLFRLDLEQWVAARNSPADPNPRQSIADDLKWILKDDMTGADVIALLGEPDAQESYQRKKLIRYDLGKGNAWQYFIWLWDDRVSDSHPVLRFEREQWIAARRPYCDDTRYNPSAGRAGMTEHLKRHTLKPGMTRDNVIALLGEPDSQNSGLTRDKLFYRLPIERDDIIALLKESDSPTNEIIYYDLGLLGSDCASFYLWIGPDKRVLWFSGLGRV